MRPVHNSPTRVLDGARDAAIWEQAARNRRWESRKLTLALPSAGEAQEEDDLRGMHSSVALPGEGGTDLGVCVASDEDGTPLSSSASLI